MGVEGLHSQFQKKEGARLRARLHGEKQETFHQAGGGGKWRRTGLNEGWYAPSRKVAFIGSVPKEIIRASRRHKRGGDRGGLLDEAITVRMESATSTAKDPKGTDVEEKKTWAERRKEKVKPRTSHYSTWGKGRDFPEEIRHPPIDEYKEENREEWAQDESPKQRFGKTVVKTCSYCLGQKKASIHHFEEKKKKGGKPN